MQVMGAKKGGTTTRQLTRKLQGMKVLNEIQQVLKIPIKYIHVIRNPYDNISTMLLRALGVRTATSDGAKVIIVWGCTESCQFMSQTERFTDGILFPEFPSWYWLSQK